MKKLLLLTALICMVACAFAQPSDAYLQGRMNAGLMPGANFLVIKNGKWGWEKSLGKANIDANKNVDRNTVFMMASVSKTMIVTAVMQLWEQGRINLDRDINHYLPFSVRTPVHPNDSITTRMLLTHTSSLRDNWNVLTALYVTGDSPIALDSFLKNYFVAGGNYYSTTTNFYGAKPGTQYNYSNTGSTLAAYLVEAITGDTYSHYCDTAIFQKLCMDHTSLLLAGQSDTTRIARPYFWDGTSYIDIGLYGYPDYPDGQLRTNITSLARFMSMYMNHGYYNGNQVLAAATVDTILKRQTNAAWYQGLIFYQAIGSNGDTLWGHNGGDGGVNTAMYFSKKHDMGIIVLTNGDGNNSSNADLLVDTLYKFGLTLTPNANDTFPPCLLTSVAGVAFRDADVVVYPNPTSGTIRITTPVAADIQVSDLQGAIVARFHVSEGDSAQTLPVSLASGMYIVRLTQKDGSVIAIRKLAVAR